MPNSPTQALISTLKKSQVIHVEDKAAQSMLVKANSHNKKQQWASAATIYAALASVLHIDANLSLQAARTYQKDGSMTDAAKWYLETAERYANQYHASKAIATLRVYVQLNPEDKENPKRIYNLCQQNDVNTNKASPPSILFTDEDRAGSKLLANQLFKTFDSKNFDDLIKGLKYHKLANDEVLTRMGEKAESLFIIISGTIAGYLTLKGKRTYLGDVFEDDICGETAYFTGGRRSAEMVAKGDTEVFELPYDMLDSFKKNLPEFNRRIEELYKSRMLVKQLALTTLFEPITAQCREDIAAKMTAIKVVSGETLFSEHENSLDVYLVRQGKLAVSVDVRGEKRLLKNIEAGGIVGEMAILANKQRTTTVFAISDCILMRLDGSDYISLYDNCLPLQEILRQIKKRHVSETLDLVNHKKRVEGDDTCTLLLKDLWAQKKTSL